MRCHPLAEVRPAEPDDGGGHLSELSVGGGRDPSGASVREAQGRVTPMHGARAAVAGGIAMMVGIWVITVNQSERGWTAQDAVLAVIAFLAMVLLLLGVDIRRRERDDDDHGNHKE